ncbi:MAG: prepilin-type N-terminal cleavage/methylation domain-containing protein [Verrucomicrobia bacterium]|nr:prepilin-type N-terminal cleavage/methylation domain-containing protein [Verrucomicrobiota bacterium]
MKTPPPRFSDLRRAFTLVEVMIAMAVGMLVMAGVLSVMVVTAKMSLKTVRLEQATVETRSVQETLNNELSIAISRTVNKNNPSDPKNIRPRFSYPSGTTAPIRYRRMEYRISLGAPASVPTNTSHTSSTLTIDCPAAVIPVAGDLLMMDTPDLGSGIRITAVSDSRTSGASGAVTLTLGQTLAAGTIGTIQNAASGARVEIHRERALEAVAASAGQATTELRLYENTQSEQYRVLSDHLDASANFLFSQEPADPSPTELAASPAVSWQFTYLMDVPVSNLAGGGDSFQTTNFSSGLIMPKSGNPLSLGSIAGLPPTTSTTTSSTTSSTSTTSTTSTSSVTTSTSSTTSKSTTTSSTSSTSSKSTTTSSTSSTSTKSSTTSSTSKTSTKSSTTSKTSTTSTKSSTTSKTSTTSTSSTTTSTTSTKSTSTSKSTTTSTKSSTTSKSTTTSTSSTTSSSTSSKSTSSTSKSSTINSTTSTKSSTTTSTKSSTSTIQFDG